MKKTFHLISLGCDKNLSDSEKILKMAVDVIVKRLTQSIKEKDDALSYDYLIINDDLEETAKHLNSLIQDQHMRLSQQGKYLDDFVKEMKELLANLK